MLLKRPTGSLILELLTEDRKSEKEKPETQNKMLDLMQQQFAVSF